MSESENIPYGFCHCGCGNKTPLAGRTHGPSGRVKGRPVRYLVGHHGHPRLERFWSKVDKGGPNGCWVWAGGRFGTGYGRFNVGGKARLAHRWAYQALVAPVDQELHLDHLCRNRACVNPSHLEPVTPRENILRGVGPAAANALKTHCPKGHAYDTENTYTNGKYRSCRKCVRDHHRRYRAAGLP